MRLVGLMPAAAVAMLLVARPALAAPDGACAPPLIVEQDAKANRRWPDLPERVHEALDARADIDPCARVKVTLRHATAIALEVVLPDGRSASRTVSRLEDVLPTLEALLLVPPPPPPPRPADLGATPPPSPAANLPADAPPAAREVAAPPGGAGQSGTGEPMSSTLLLEQRPRPLRIELSLAAAARLGGGEAGAAMGAASFIEVGRWLAGFEGRVEGYRRRATGGPSGAVELAVLAGRRFFLFETRALDLFAGPALALPGGSETVAVRTSNTAAATPPSPPAAATGIVPRLRVGTRLSFRALSVLRPFAAIDGDFGPASRTPAGSLRLPAWTAGLAIGVTVGTP